MTYKISLLHGALIMCLGILSGCGQAQPSAQQTPGPQQIEIDIKPETDVATVEASAPVLDMLPQRETWCNGVAIQSAEWLACAEKNYAVSDQALNVVYNELRTFLDPQGKTLLRDAQREWIKFRNADCAWKADPSRHGNIAPQMKAKCLTDITDERVLLLTANIYEIQKPVVLPPLLEKIRTLEASPLCMPISDQGTKTGTEFSIENCENDITIVQRVRGKTTHSVDYTDEGRENWGLRPININYNVLGVIRDKLFVSLYLASGGTHATSITLKLEQVGDQLRVVHTYAFGYACYGGLVDLSVSDGHSHYTTNLPRHELINLGSGKAWTNNYVFPDNPRIPETCFALEEYVDDVLKGVRFSKDFVARMSEDTLKEVNRPEQYCMDQYFVDAYKAGKISYTIAELKPVIKEVKRTCLGE